ncbi:MAG: hypothetical protein VR69_15920 [Peptococcaceae bacterium BRH_c4b]|nr:MAG: hypothetical protein VR69_15920 [Peptococcaceae bacterium BRH_c4b]
MNQESIYALVNYSNLTANAEINLMNNLSSNVHNNLSKGFLWIPYYGTGTNAGEIIKRIGYVINTRNIYDIAVIQPHYYFDSSVQANLNGVYYSVKNINNPSMQGVSYRDGAVVVSKTSNTIIGAEMECDWHIVPPNSNSSYQSRYNEYVTKFSPLKSSYPIAFYWSGDPQSALANLINPFYK